MRNNTCELVPCPTNRKIIDNKWLFMIKEWVGGSLDKLKSRLVTKGQLQVADYDFVETFSSIVKYATIWVLLSIAFSNHYVHQQLDINNAFLNGNLQEEVYIRQHTDFVDK